MFDILLIMMFTTTKGGAFIETKHMKYIDYKLDEKQGMKNCHLIGKTFLEMKTAPYTTKDYKCIVIK